VPAAKEIRHERCERNKRNLLRNEERERRRKVEEKVIITHLEPHAPHY
jgi:hypothetical protein